MHNTNPARRVRATIAAAALLAVAVLAAGCSSGSTGTITVEGAWARTSAMVSGAGAGYIVIKNTGSADDAITGGTTSVAKTVEVHETVDMSSAAPMPSASGEGMGGMDGGMASPAASDGMGGMSDSGSSGMMGMRKIDRLVIPAGGSVELKPGGYHLMIIELNQELKAGTKIEITLNFERAGPMKVTFEVREG